jgi:YD repeat-containing protein
VGTNPLTFTYDSGNQQLADGTSTFSYDALGNRQGGGYSTAAVNETTTDGTWTYSYDAAGQRTGKSRGTGSTYEGWSYTYDHDGHLTRVERWAGVTPTRQIRIDYAYDAFGNRISRLEYNGALTLQLTERFAYDGWKTNQDRLGDDSEFVGQENWDVWADLGSTNALTVRRVYGGGCTATGSTNCCPAVRARPCCGTTPTAKEASAS